jgi:hypothetical protein
MGRQTDGEIVVQTVPMLRAQAVTCTLLALLALAVAAALARNPLDVIVGSAIGAILWSAGMHFVLIHRPYDLPPVRISADYLPPRGSVWKLVISAIVIFTAFYAAEIAYSLDADGYFVFGIGLGVPILLWDIVQTTRQMQRKEQGVLWSNAVWPAWRKRDRVRYLAVDEQADEENSNYENEDDG